MTLTSGRGSVAAGERDHPATSTVVLAALLDVLSVVVFVAVGRRSHDESGSVVAGIARVAAPFLIALAVGWLLSRAWRSPTTLGTACVIWLVTVALGMVLRHTAFDRGTATSFIVVATIATFVLLLGWRLIRNLAANRSA